MLARRDWDKYSAHPAYGMPNYAGGNIVVAGESSTFWQGFAAALELADRTDREAVFSTYAKGGEIDLAPFFDLLAVHELAHLYHEAVCFRFPALWLMELFCNLALQSYVATYEPTELPVLETFPQAFARLDASAFPHRSLYDFERLYVEVCPENYGWYQANLHVGARRNYDSGGVDALSRMWKTFALDAERLSSILESEVDPEAARLVRDWPPAT